MYRKSNLNKISCLKIIIFNIILSQKDSFYQQLHNQTLTL